MTFCIVDSRDRIVLIIGAGSYILEHTRVKHSKEKHLKGRANNMETYHIQNKLSDQNNDIVMRYSNRD